MLDHNNKLSPEEDRPAKPLLADFEEDNESEKDNVTGATEAKVNDDDFHQRQTFDAWKCRRQLIPITSAL